ncbi:ATP synthase subunit I [Neolewinella antarctica]|uniref:F1F0 ATPase subunit 2 n=1 Tax=Neolewinella antarctica TaxID=442734 RepID=A0ABX0XCH1_9BACT|nr:ATP synthase subunit I [Neolewinella antarctica]NJC26956.1 F1F0 ATPase subunit 2 [Neolewinella antarctica]
MNEILLMMAALVKGGLLGVFFFGGLWLTVRKAVASTSPARWLLGSLILRVGIVVIGFYIVMQGANWLNGLVCLLGFVAARVIIFRLTQTPETSTKLSTIKIKEATHEA